VVTVIEFPDTIANRRSAKTGPLSDTEFRNLDTLLTRFWSHHAGPGDVTFQTVAQVREIGRKAIADRARANRKSADNPHRLSASMRATLVGIGQGMVPGTTSTRMALRERGLIVPSTGPRLSPYVLTSAGVAEIRRIQETQSHDQ
jgi:hypothetical protein